MKILSHFSNQCLDGGGVRIAYEEIKTVSRDMFILCSIKQSLEEN